MTMKKLTIGTRGSMLALWQANHMKDLIEQHNDGLTVDLKIIKTTGDKILDVPLSQVGGKSLFVKEIETELMDGTVDLAVHSMKDVPMDLPEGLLLFACPEAEEPNDALLSVKYSALAELPNGAVVGTSSLRRKVQLMALRPDLEIRDLRGNVDTRINKMKNGEYDAIILAKAGLKRLGLTEHIVETIPVSTMLPAVCQGVLGIETRENDPDVFEKLDFLKHEHTETRAFAERAFLRRLEGGCQAPIAIHSLLENGTLTLRGLVASLDGTEVIRQELIGQSHEAEHLGTELAERMLSAGAKKILEEIYGSDV